MKAGNRRNEGGAYLDQASIEDIDIHAFGHRPSVESRMLKLRHGQFEAESKRSKTCQISFAQRSWNGVYGRQRGA